MGPLTATSIASLCASAHGQIVVQEVASELVCLFQHTNDVPSYAKMALPHLVSIVLILFVVYLSTIWWCGIIMQNFVPLLFSLSSICRTYTWDSSYAWWWPIHRNVCKAVEGERVPKQPAVKVESESSQHVGMGMRSLGMFTFLPFVTVVAYLILDEEIHQNVWSKLHTFTSLECSN